MARLTLKFLEELGKAHGIKIERRGRGNSYDVWKHDHTIHEVPNLMEAYRSINELKNEK
jgi:hypothetical protein